MELLFSVLFYVDKVTKIHHLTQLRMLHQSHLKNVATSFTKLGNKLTTQVAGFDEAFVDL